MNITNSQTISAEFESDAEAGSEQDTLRPPPTTIGRHDRRRLGDQFRPFIGYTQFQSTHDVSRSSPSPNGSNKGSEDASEVSEDSIVNTTFESTTIKLKSTGSHNKESQPLPLDHRPAPLENQEPTIISADNLDRASNSAAQVLHYHSSHNSLSRRARFHSEEPSSFDSELDEDRNPKGEEVMWTDEWWAQIGHINGGYRGRNYVKERSRDHGEDKRG
jgi:hypothetical protein